MIPVSARAVPWEDSAAVISFFCSAPAPWLPHPVVKTAAVKVRDVNAANKTFLIFIIDAPFTYTIYLWLFFSLYS